MKTNVQYFGMIADKLSKSSEEMEFDLKVLPMNLREYFEGKYPILSDMSYQIAINQELTDTLERNVDLTEIALLPPFAGG